MVDTVDFSLVGLGELLVKMDSVTNDLKKKGGRFALRKAANVIKEAAQKNADRVDDPRTPESISANVAIRWSTRLHRRTGNLGFRIGILGGARQDTKAFEALGFVSGKGKANPGGDTFYWRFIEFGTEETDAQPFLRRALSQNIEAATDTFIVQYEKALDRAIKRASK